MIGGTMETVGLLAGIGILPVEFIEATFTHTTSTASSCFPQSTS